MSNPARIVLLAAAAATLLGVAPPPIPVPPAVEPMVQRGPSGRIVLVRATGEFLVDARRVAEALPAARVGDAPVCLLVEDRLTAAQAHLLARVPVREIVCVGEPPDDAADLVTRRVESPRELDEPSAEAVVCSPHLGDVLSAAPLAFRRRVPLLVQDETLLDRIARLGVERVVTVGAFMEVALPATIERSDRSEPAARWGALAAERGAAPYLAVANIHPGRSWASGSPLAAMLLAARRGGMLLLLDEPVELLYAEMKRTNETPPGLADLDAAGWLAGTLPTGDGGRLVAVERTRVEMMPGVTVDKYLDPIVDLDGDGRLDPDTERVPVGDARTIDGTEYSISSRLVGILGITKFIDGQRTNRVVAVRPAAETIARRLATLYAAAGPPSALLLGGDHREIPFDYVRDPVYAATTMHEQELASDNLYADVDGDGRLDVPVGRIVSSGPVVATTTAARISAYERLGGPWRRRACAAYPVWPDDETTLHIPFVFASFEAFVHGLGRDFDVAGYETRLHLRDEGTLEAVYPDLAGSTWIVFAQHSGTDAWVFRVVMHDGRPRRRVLLPHRHPDIDEPPPGCGFVPPFDGAPVVVSAGCDSAGLDFEPVWPRSIVHSFLEQGAVAYLGNTRAGIPDTEEFVLRQTIQAATGVAPGPAGRVPLGEALRRGKNLLDLVIATRGPMRSIEPFQDHLLSMRRAWHSMVLLGDPALVVASPGTPDTPAAPGPPVRVATEREDGRVRVVVTWDGRVDAETVWIMERPGIGPLRELTAVVAAGLGYASVPWATYEDAARPGPVGPGVFLEIAWPGPGTPRVRVVEGPPWALGGWRAARDVAGDPLVQLSIDLVRHAMMEPAEAAEVAERVVLEITGDG